MAEYTVRTTAPLHPHQNPHEAHAFTVVVVLMFICFVYSLIFYLAALGLGCSR